MTLCRLHIALCLLALLLLTGCRKEEDTLPADGPRTLTLDLGITLTRATEGEDTGDNSRPGNLMLWIFNDEEKLFYENITDDLDFSITDMNNHLVQTIERIIEVGSGIQTLHFYIVMNTDGLKLSEDSTPEAIEAATFTYQDTWTGDNLVPLYGEETLDVSRNRSEYSISIETKRAVGKLELFFTKESESSYLKINSVSITHDPDKGYLTVPGTYQLTYSTAERNLFTTGKEINAVLTTAEEAGTGNFSQYENNNSKMESLFSTYLLENPNGGTWTETDNKDYTYPYDPETHTGVQDEETRYKLTVNYQTSETGTAKTQVIYLPKIERNVWNKVFARVKDDGFAIALQVLPWEDVVESEIGWNANTSTGSNAPMTAWRLNNGKIDPDHKNATNGDDEATYCYVVNPRYNGNSHDGLVEASSYAGFYFKLSGPAGAVWKAHLSNEEYFGFGTGTYTITDEDGEEHTRRCATTGIARNDPYQIQIYAKKPWTEGTSFDKLTGEIPSNTKIKTEFWITVTLSDGYEYELVINPSDDYVTDTYYRDKRRFAGTDTRITLWQLRALEGYSYDELMDYHINNNYITNPWWTGEGD